MRAKRTFKPIFPMNLHDQGYREFVRLIPLFKIDQIKGISHVKAKKIVNNLDYNSLPEGVPVSVSVPIQRILD